jgi:PAS domain S-box-containing protein
MSVGMSHDESLLAIDVLETPEAAFSVDMDRRIVAWNEGAEELFGYRAREAIGARCYDLVGGCQRAALGCGQRCAAVENARRGRPTRTFEMAMPTGSEDPRWLQVITLLARSGGGQRRVVHLLRDVSAHHRAGGSMARAVVHARASAGASGTAVSRPGFSPSGFSPSGFSPSGFSPSEIGAGADGADGMVSPPGVSGVVPRQLTPRELEVLRLLVCGLATHEIAATLSISRITARNHVTNVMEKLGAGTRLQAILVAAQLNVI